MAAAHSKNMVVKAVVLQWGCLVRVLAKLGTDKKQGRKEEVGWGDRLSVWLSGMLLWEYSAMS